MYEYKKKKKVKIRIFFSDDFSIFSKSIATLTFIHTRKKVNNNNIINKKSKIIKIRKREKKKLNEKLVLVK